MNSIPSGKSLNQLPDTVFKISVLIDENSFSVTRISNHAVDMASFNRFQTKTSWLRNYTTNSFCINSRNWVINVYDDIIKWKYFLCYSPFVRGIHRSPVDSPHKGQWRGTFMFSLICVWTNDWTSNRDAGDLRHHSTQCDVTVMIRYWLVAENFRTSSCIHEVLWICQFDKSRPSCMDTHPSIYTICRCDQHIIYIHSVICRKIEAIYSATFKHMHLVITAMSEWARWRLKSPASRPCGEFTGDRWIPRTNGQYRGKCFHLMTSSYCQFPTFISMSQP